MQFSIFFNAFFEGTIFFFEGGISFLGVTFCQELFFVGEIFDINKANYPDSEHPVQFPSYKHLSSIVLCAKTSPSPTGFKNLHFLHKRWNLFLPLQAVKCQRSYSLDQKEDSLASPRVLHAPQINMPLLSRASQAPVAQSVRASYL